MNLCQFHMTHAHVDGHHVFYPHCGCGWTGDPYTFESLPTGDELRQLGWRWNNHYVTWKKYIREERRAFI